MKCNRIGFQLFSEQKCHTKMPTVAATMENAFRYHQGGLLQEAEKLYRPVLQNNPENPAALHSLGIIAHQMRKPLTLCSIGEFG